MAAKMTRRNLGRAATAAMLVGNVGTDVSSAERKTDSSAQELDPVAWTLQQYQSAPLRLTFRATTQAEAEQWQQQLRAKLTELLGGFPERNSLNVRTLEKRDLGGYTREKIWFESRPGNGVIIYLLTPAKSRAPHPCVICVPGHGRGVDDIVGIDESGKDRTGKPGYQQDFAIQAVEQGLAAVAIEPMAFGYRRDAITVEKGPTVSACQPAAGSALLMGQTMIGWRVWDIMRAVDWIGTRPELDSQRIGCMGISGGGTCTQFSTALDTRIKAAFVSGYLNTFRDSIMSLSHCIDNYVPGILNWAENYDVAGLIAPRPFFSEGGSHDPIFPVAATRESFMRVQKVYGVFGALDSAQQEIFDGVHEFHGVKGLPFLAKALGAKSGNS
jgi:hypothetical protein